MITEYIVTEVFYIVDDFSNFKTQDGRIQIKSVDSEPATMILLCQRLNHTCHYFLSRLRPISISSMSILKRGESFFTISFSNSFNIIVCGLGHVSFSSWQPKSSEMSSCKLGTTLKSKGNRPYGGA